ncbi:ATP-binding protein [Actinoplanes missouriensis]|uniref:ATP-binding protein n=1 Tax=Actinoplanes missouriensis TaxID=1866 RepID=UPI0033CE9690
MSVNDAERPDDVLRGRESARRTLAAFLRQPPGSAGANVLLLTGSAGTGKSKLMTRLVSGADRGTLFDPGPVDVTIDARGSGVEDVRSRLLAALAKVGGRLGGRSPSIPAAVAAARSRLGRPIVLLLDNLDQATSPATVLDAIVVPVARMRHTSGSPAVRLVLALRTIHCVGSAVLGLSAQVRQMLGDAVEPAELRMADGELVPDLFSHLTALTGRATDHEPGDELIALAGDITPSFALAAAAAAAGDTLVDTCAALLAADVVAVATDDSVSPAELVAALRAAALSLDEGAPLDDTWSVMTGAVAATELADPERLPLVVAESRLGGYLMLVPGETGPALRVIPDVAADLLAKEPSRLWSEIQKLLEACGLPPPERAGVCDPEPEVHRRITAAFVTHLIVQGLISAHDPVAESTEDDEEEDFSARLVTVATDPERSIYDRIDAIRGLVREGDEATAISLLSAVTADPGAGIRERYQAARELWQMAAADDAVRAYRLLSDVPDADRQAMLKAVDDILAGAEAPPSYKTPGIPIMPPPPSAFGGPRPLGF